MQRQSAIHSIAIFSILLISEVITNNLSAQNFEWVKTFKDYHNSIGNCIAIDALNNVYTTGSFTDTMDFDHGPNVFNEIAVGQLDIFIHKMDASGNFVWVKTIGGVSSEFGSSISIDSSGNVYVAGGFRNTVDFDPGPGTALLTASSNIDYFILKLDASGNFLWAKSFDGNVFSMKVDGAGNVHTTGIFSGTIDFDPGPDTSYLSSLGNALDIFVQKLDANGDFLWAKAFSGPNIDFGFSITLDDMGNVYTAGYFAETVDFDPGPDTSFFTSAGQTDVFVHKMDASGNFIWVKTFGGINYDYCYSISVDPSGNILTSGIFEATSDFDPGIDTFFLTATGNFGIFVHKMDNAGNFLWAKSMVGTDGGTAVSTITDVSGNVYTAGRFLETLDFDPGSGEAIITSLGKDDFFVQKMDASGNFLWVSTLGGPERDECLDIVVDKKENVYSKGNFSGTVDFDPGLGTEFITSVGSIGSFVHKMSSATTGIRIIDSETYASPYPNPTNGVVGLSFEKPLMNVTITVTDVRGRIVYKNRFDTLTYSQIHLTGAAGLYLLRIETPNGQQVVKLIKE